MKYYYPVAIDSEYVKQYILDHPRRPNFCHGTTKDGKRCTHRVSDPNGLYCWRHTDQENSTLVKRCTALNASGHQCSKAVDVDPDYCEVHGRIAGRHEYKDGGIHKRDRDPWGQLK